MIVSPLIFVFIYCLDCDGDHWQIVPGARNQHVHLIFEPFTLDLLHKTKVFLPECPQAGLGILQPFPIQQEEQYAQTKQRQYRSKQQRAQDAKRREQIRTLENEIEQLEQMISKLEAEIADPETAADYNLINEKCSQLDEARNSLEDKMEQWAELSDMI